MFQGGFCFNLGSMAPGGCELFRNLLSLLEGAGWRWGFTVCIVSWRSHAIFRERRVLFKKEKKNNREKLQSEFWLSTVERRVQEMWRWRCFNPRRLKWLQLPAAAQDEIYGSIYRCLLVHFTSVKLGPNVQKHSGNHSYEEPIREIQQEFDWNKIWSKNLLNSPPPHPTAPNPRVWVLSVVVECNRSQGIKQCYPQIVHLDLRWIAHG